MNPKSKVKVRLEVKSNHPNRSTREEFTQALVKTELPEDANPEWLDLARKLRNLLDELAHHPAMAENLHQTYMTPAADKNRVYFMWDFVGRTLVIPFPLFSPSPTLWTED